MKSVIKLNKIPKIPFVIISIISAFGMLILYSINSGNFYPWAFNQMLRFIVGLIFMYVGASINPVFWKKHAYIFYIICVIMLLIVAVAGKISMGAQRWLNFYFFNFQPSELMRIFLIIALAKYFSSISTDDIRKTRNIIFPLFILSIPMGLVLLQPDLGTAMLFFLVSASVMFVCGVQIWKFIAVFLSVILSAPILWSMLHDYQKDRILMFLSPEKDPGGAGYHIIQSQIALGSGGLFGKGLLGGTQCQLNFLPEKQTDFVFSALGEELGFIGGLVLIILYAVLIIYNSSVSVNSRNKFSQILVFGLNSMLFFYIFINISMVCGMLPVVGIPLPFFSYGGSALVVLMFCQGLIFAVDNEQKVSSRFS